MSGGKARSKLVSWFDVQEKPYQSSTAFLAKKPHLDTRTESCQGGRNTAFGLCVSSTDSTKQRSRWGDGVPDGIQSMTSSPSSSPVLQVGTLSNFSDQWRSINCNRFVLNSVKGHHLQPRWHPPLFWNFKWFNIKAAMAHHPIIQKEVNELSAKGATEPLTGGTGFHSNVCVAPKCTGGLQVIFKSKVI